MIAQIQPVSVVIKWFTLSRATMLAGVRVGLNMVRGYVDTGGWGLLYLSML